MREIVLDIETTGLNYKKGDKLIEIACVELVNKIITGKVFHTYVYTKVGISDNAFNIHGISNHFLRDKPNFSHISKNLLYFISNARLIAHNASFDIGFINHELKKYDLPNIPSCKIIDTLLIARREFPNKPVNLNALCKRFEISLNKRKKHGALIDAKLLSAVYIKLSLAKQTSFKFINYIDKIKNPNFKNKRIVNRTFYLSKSEQISHKLLIKNLTKVNLYL